MPDLSSHEIADRLRELLGDEAVVTDEDVLRRSSVDNFRKLETIFGAYTRPLPAAVARPRSTEEVAAVLSFADAHGVLSLIHI